MLGGCCSSRTTWITRVHLTGYIHCHVNPWVYSGFFIGFKGIFRVKARRCVAKWCWLLAFTPPPTFHCALKTTVASFSLIPLLPLTLPLSSSLLKVYNTENLAHEGRISCLLSLVTVYRPMQARTVMHYTLFHLISFLHFPSFSRFPLCSLSLEQGEPNT